MLSIIEIALLTFDVIPYRQYQQNYHIYQGHLTTTFCLLGTLSEQIAHSTVEISEFLHGSVMNKPESAAQHTRIKFSRYVYSPLSQLLLRVYQFFLPISVDGRKHKTMFGAKMKFLHLQNCTLHQIPKPESYVALYILSSATFHRAPRYGGVRTWVDTENMWRRYTMVKVS